MLDPFYLGLLIGPVLLALFVIGLERIVRRFVNFLLYGRADGDSGPCTSSPCRPEGS